MDCIYANNIKVVTSDVEVFITFSWAVPGFNEDGEISGDETIGQRSVVISKKTAEALESMLHSVLHGETKAEE